MRKVIFTFLLAIVSSVWMMSKADHRCLPSALTETEPKELLSGQWDVYKEDITGIFYDEQGIPRHETHTREIDEGDYRWVFNYDTMYSPSISCFSAPATYTLEALEKGKWLLTVEGRFDTPTPDVPAESSGRSPIIIHQLHNNWMEWEYTIYGDDEGPYCYYQYLKRHIEEVAKLPSFCDEWNILRIVNFDGINHFSSHTQNLTTDTVIGGNLYAKLEQSEKYLGAMREGENRDIYYVPNGTTHEYLLYAFNAQIGDTLNNMWVGGRFSNNGRRATVREIKETSPKIFVVGYEYVFDEWWEDYKWIDGVGMTFGPSGNLCPFDCAGDYGEVVLCAYKNSEQVYFSSLAEQYGCEYDGEELSGNNVPLYSRNDSGSAPPKVLLNGHLYILHGEKVYTLQGQEVK